MYKENRTNKTKEENFLLTLLKHVDAFFFWYIILPSIRRRQIPKVVLVVLVVDVVTDQIAKTDDHMDSTLEKKIHCDLKNS
jgi:hypothetical protein